MSVLDISSCLNLRKRASAILKTATQSSYKIKFYNLGELTMKKLSIMIRIDG